MKDFVKTPKSISFSAIVENNFTFSSSQYKQLDIKNTNLKPVSAFMKHKLARVDLGEEIGSINYIDHSTHYFMRTKALQEHSFLPEISKETVLPMNPKAFKNMNLKKGDVIISKDSNIGEIAILEKDYPNVMLSGAIYKLPISKMKYYLLAFIKHSIFRQQLEFLVPKGATIRHAKTLFLDCLIPIPNTNIDNTITLVEVLTQAIINKEITIKERHKKILEDIEYELKSNQKNEQFSYEFPRYNEVVGVGRLDTGLYTKYFKSISYEVLNYKFGYTTIDEMGFALSRGQNLQVSNIGKSIYSETKHDNFYTLMLPKFLSPFGTVNTVEYLGNASKLKTLKKGDLIFGAEGFEKGRSIVIIEDTDRTITNIHGITVQQKEHNIEKGIFVKCFLDYLRSKRLIDLMAVGGNGGSLAQKYWRYILFPLFDPIKQKKISVLYHNPNAVFDPSKCDLGNFLNYDSQFNRTAGIYELDKSAKLLKSQLNKVIENIIDNVTVTINFNFD